MHRVPPTSASRADSRGSKKEEVGMRKKSRGRCTFIYNLQRLARGREGGGSLSAGTIHPVRRCEASRRRKCRVCAVGSLREVVRTRAANIWCRLCFVVVSSLRTLARYRPSRKPRRRRLPFPEHCPSLPSLAHDMPALGVCGANLEGDEVKEKPRSGSSRRQSRGREQAALEVAPVWHGARPCT
jgi:hypothetical protein